MTDTPEYQKILQERIDTYAGDFGAFYVSMNGKEGHIYSAAFKSGMQDSAFGRKKSLNPKLLPKNATERIRSAATEAYNQGYDLGPNVRIGVMDLMIAGKLGGN